MVDNQAKRLQKEKRSVKNLTVRTVLFALGSFIISIGVSAFVLTDTGSDTFSVFMQGVARTLGVSNGMAHILINLTMIIGILIFTKGYIKLGTIAALVIMGPSIDFVSYLLGGIITAATPFYLRLIIMALACVVCAFGLAVIICADIGIGANDLMSVILSDKAKIQFRWARISVDATLVVVGFFLGGVVGIGTIVNIILIGPIAQFFMPHVKKSTASIVNRFR